MDVRQEQTGFSVFVLKYKLLWLLLVMVVGVGIDQATKIWAQNTLAEAHEMPREVLIDGQTETVTETRYFPTRAVVVIPGVWNLIYKENPAAAFSLTKSIPEWFRRPLLISVSIIATIVFLFLYFRIRTPDGLLLTSLSMILAGAIGNFLDRVRLGYVIDFLDIHAGFLGYENMHWPTFNVADSLIVVGTIGFIYRNLKPLPEPQVEGPKET